MAVTTSLAMAAVPAMGCRALQRTFTGLQTLVEVDTADMAGLLHLFSVTHKPVHADAQISALEADVRFCRLVYAQCYTQRDCSVKSWKENLRS